MFENNNFNLPEEEEKEYMKKEYVGAANYSN